MSVTLIRTAQVLTALLLVSCGGGGGNPPAQPMPPPPAAINMDQVLDDFIANNSNVPSLAMLVVRDGAIIYSHTAGFMDAARTRPPSQATLSKTSAYPQD